MNLFLWTSTLAEMPSKWTQFKQMDIVSNEKPALELFSAKLQPTIKNSQGWHSIIIDLILEQEKESAFLTQICSVNFRRRLESTKL